MKINRKELLKKLEIIKASLATSGEDLSQKAINFCESTVFGYNQTIFASAALNNLDFEASTNGNKLITLIKKLKAEEVELSRKDGSLLIKAGNSRSKLPIDGDIKIPANLVDCIPDKKLPSNFAEGIEEAMMSVGHRDKAYLNNIQIVGSDIQSTNNSSITCFEMDESVDEEIFVPMVAAKYMKIMNPTHYSKEGGWLCFSNEEDEVLFCSRMMDTSNFPPLSQFREQLGEGEEIVFPDGFVDALDEANVFLKGIKEVKQTVIIESDGECVSVSVKNENGSNKTKLKTTCKCEYKVYLKPTYLIKTLKKKPKIQLAGGNILKIEGEKFVHLINGGEK